MKFALIGHDIPTLLPTILTDMLFAGKQAAEVAVHENNPAMQDVLRKYGEAVIARSGLDAEMFVSGDRYDVLDGADCVIYADDHMPASCFRMDREALSGVDEEDEGLTDQARVNGGIGGLMHALRAGRLVIELCTEMEEVCPDALVINLAQPVARTTEIFLLQGFKTYALGRSPMRGANGVDALATKLGLKTRELAADSAGLPGFAFLLSLSEESTGRDLMPRVMEMADEEELGRLTKRWLDWYGMIALGDVTDHAEFLPAQPDYIPEAEPVFGETVEQRKERILHMNTIGQQGAASKEGAMAQVTLLSKAPPIRPMQLALAILRGETISIPAVTRRNNGELPQLERGVIIESTLTLENGEARPHGTMLPDELADVMSDIAEANHLAALAAMGDHSALRECIEMDPALAGLDRLYCQELVEKMIDMHRDAVNEMLHS